jgi:predicted ArsR family transcriptional regulator
VQRVLSLLAAARGPLTVREVAEQVNLHPNAARAHLEALVDARLATAAQLPPRGRGRPPSGYAVSPAGRVRAGAHADDGSLGARERVLWMLDRLGFAPDPDPVSAVVALRACPFLDRARREPQTVCAVHARLVADAYTAFGGPGDRVELAAFAERGTCVLTLPRT